MASEKKSWSEVLIGGGGIATIFTFGLLLYSEIQEKPEVATCDRVIVMQNDDRPFQELGEPMEGRLNQALAEKAIHCAGLDIGNAAPRLAE
jgi:hypothetical protein